MKPESLIAYLDRELSSEEEKQVEVELNADPELRKLLSELYYHRFLFVEAHHQGALQSPSTALPGLKQKSPNHSFSPKIPLSPTSWGLIAASFLVFFILQFYPSSQSHSSKSVKVAILNQASPGAEVLRDDQKIAATPGMDIFNHDTIMTTSNNPVTLQYFDGSLVKLYPKSMLVLGDSPLGESPANASDLIFLRTGKLIAKISPQKSNQQKYFFTPQGKVEVVGTEFYLDVPYSKKNILRMLDGTVRFTELQNQKTIELSKSQWALIQKKADFIPRQGTPQIFKNGKPLLHDVFDPQLKKWTFDQVKASPASFSPDKKLITGMTLIPTHKKTSKATIKLPSIQQQAFKSLAVELEYMSYDLDDANLNILFSRDGSNVRHSPLFEPYFSHVQLKENRWRLLRFEFEEFELSNGIKSIHLTCQQGKSLVADQWLEEAPDRLEITFTRGKCSIQNFQAFELVPDTF